MKHDFEKYIDPRCDEKQVEVRVRRVPESLAAKLKQMADRRKISVNDLMLAVIRSTVAKGD